MKLSELKYIVAVAREKHFGRAAEACCVSQPTLSVAVKKLEEELQCIIFERGATEINLTPMGAKIIAQAQRVLEDVEGVKQIAQSSQGAFSEPLRIGAIYTIGPYIFPRLIPSLKQAAPELPLYIEEAMTAQLELKLRNGEVDIIIVAEPFDIPGVETRSLYDEEFVVALPPNHPLRERALISADDLEQENVLLLGPGHCFRDQVLDVCPGCVKPAGQANLQQTVEGGSLETICHMVAAGTGVTVLPCSSVQESLYDPDLLSVVPFTPPVPTRRVAMAWRTSFPRQEVIDKVFQVIQQHLPGCVTPVK